MSGLGVFGFPWTQKWDLDHVAVAGLVAEKPHRGLRAAAALHAPASSAPRLSSPRPSRRGGCVLFHGGRLDGCEAAPRCGSDLLCPGGW